MSKKNASLTVNADLSDLFTEKPPKQQSPLVTKGMPIEKALFTIIRHIEATGFRKRTISDYRLHITHFKKITDAEFLDELTASHLYEWLSSMNASATRRN